MLHQWAALLLPVPHTATLSLCKGLFVQTPKCGMV